MLGNSDIETIRRSLITERERLVQSIEGQDFELPIDDNPDEEDLADYVADQELRSSLVDFSEGILERIQQALERLENGTYGVCQKCKEEIPLERLVALPYAELCVRCQERMEKARVIV